MYGLDFRVGSFPILIYLFCDLLQRLGNPSFLIAYRHYAQLWDLSFSWNYISRFKFWWSMAKFLSRIGYHGPEENKGSLEISGVRSWLRYKNIFFVTWQERTIRLSGKCVIHFVVIYISNLITNSASCLINFKGSLEFDVWKTMNFNICQSLSGLQILMNVLATS